MQMPISKPLILIVEDEEDMLMGLKHNLEFEGYETVTATDGREALQKAHKATPDLVLLDIMLPEVNGFEVLRELRTTQPRTPVILLTSKGLEADKLQGFSLGADDYVTKPFSIQELMARVQAVLKRSQAHPGPAGTLRFGAVEVDLARRLVSRDGRPVPLALKEYEMLRLLLRHRGEIVTRERMLYEVWGYHLDNVPNTRTVDNHIAKLRNKIGPELIETVQKVGYKFNG
jgi:two-component system alkaline phosphatase synthesis response regulator PhoP